MGLLEYFMFENFKEIVSLWPSLAILADDVGVGHGAVLKWSQRDNIDPKYWKRLIAAAKKRRIPHVTAKNLVEICAERFV